MANVFLNDEAYSTLKNLKNEEESFSEIVLKLAKKENLRERNVMKFFGAFPEISSEEFDKKLKIIRKNRTFK